MFKPTFLYLKRHTKTGKLYFGKTTKQNVEKYNGSGKHWGNHITYYGRQNVETLWYCLYTVEAELLRQAILLSKIMNIVESEDFLNLQDENGIDGAPAGNDRSHKRGFSTYKDADGNKFHLKSGDPLITELGLTGNNTGLKMSEDSKEVMRRSKDHARKITLHFMTLERVVNINDPDFVPMLDQGWLPYIQQERLEAGKDTRREGVRKTICGRNRYYNRDGTFWGMLANDDPLVAELDLIHIRQTKQTANQVERMKQNSQNKEMQARKGKTLSTRKWCHDPATGENRRLEQIPDGWKSGRTEPTLSRGSKQYWNDGTRNYQVLKNQIPEPHWKLGMCPRKAKLNEVLVDQS